MKFSLVKRLPNHHPQESSLLKTNAWITEISGTLNKFVQMKGAILLRILQR